MIRRTHTRLALVTYPHDSEKPVELSRRVHAFSISKNKASVGQASFRVLGGANLHNVVQPGDWLAAWVDTGEGRGLEWVFFGQLDAVSRVQESYPDGSEMTSMFELAASDFQIAVDQCQLFSNAWFQVRRDMSIDANLSINLTQGGFGLAPGYFLQGSPAAFVEYLLISIGGFAKQFTLPKSMPVDREAIMAKRKILLSRGLRLVPKDTVDQHLGWEFTTTGLDEPNAYQRVVEAVEAIERESKAQGRSKELLDALELRVLAGLLRTLSDSAPITLMDLLSFDFIEHGAVAGWYMTRGVMGGTVNMSLGDLLREYQNGIVNELIFDLRPVAAGQNQRFGNADLISAPVDYVATPDMLGGSGGTTDVSSDVGAVQYVPAVVMREHPFSVVPGVDLSHVRVYDKDLLALVQSSRKSGPKIDDTETFGFIPFGPIFAQQRTGSGDATARVLYDYRYLIGLDMDVPNECTLGWNPSTRTSSTSGDVSALAPIKHLDVSVVRDDEILSDARTRARGAVANIISMYSRSVDPVLARLWMTDVLPITNGVSIQRYGIRSLELPTLFLDFPTEYTRRADNALRLKDQPSQEMRVSSVRWALLVDHWVQHAPEYLHGTITLGRVRADVRVGYRLDEPDRRLSSYVEAWQIDGDVMDDGAVRGQTRLTLSRGQRTDPFPVYVPPFLPERRLDTTPASAVPPQSSSEATQDALDTTPPAPPYSGDRSQQSRLAHTFPTIDAPGDEPSQSGQYLNEIDSFLHYPGVIVQAQEWVKP
jgi:hypothetical protein